MKKSARGDKRDFLEKKAATAEEAAKPCDSKTVYKITNEIIGKRRNLNGPVKDQNGKMVTPSNEISEVLGRTFWESVQGTVDSFWNTLKEAYNQTTLETYGHKKDPNMNGYPIWYESSLKSVGNWNNVF